MTIVLALLLALQQPATPPAPATPAAPRAAQPAPARRPPATATIQVRVTNQSGMPVEGAQIRAIGPSLGDATTDSNGTVVFRTMNPGSYRLRAEADDLVMLEKEITVRAPTTRAEMALSMAPPKAAPAEREAPPPPPPPPPPPSGERGEPRALSIPDLAEASLNGRDPVKVVPIGCAGMSQARLIVLREGVPANAFEDVDETLYLVAGEATLNLGGKEQSIAPGWFSIVPRGTKMGLGRKGRNPAILLSILYGRPCGKAATAQP